MGYCITLKRNMKTPSLFNFFKRAGGQGPRVSVSFSGNSVLFVGVKRSGGQIKVVNIASST